MLKINISKEVKEFAVYGAAAGVGLVSGCWIADKATKIVDTTVEFAKSTVNGIINKLQSKKQSTESE